PIPGKDNRMHLSFMPPELADEAPSRDIPQIDAVRAARRQYPAVRGKREAVHITRLLIELRGWLPRWKRPQPHDRTSADDRQPSATGRHGRKFGSVVWRLEPVQFLAGGNVPQFGAGALRSNNELLAVRRKSH